MRRGIKHGHLPGDISKGAKILLLERRTIIKNGVKYPPPELTRSELKGIRSYKECVLMKERAVLKKRFQRGLADVWNESFGDD